MTVETPTCGELIYRAKGQGRLRCDDIDPESDLWRFVGTWIRRLRELDPEQDLGAGGRSRNSRSDHYFERFIFLWVSVNAWASMVVSDRSRNHEDAYLVHSLARDPVLNEHFHCLLENRRFLDDASAFAALGPVFQVLWLRNNNIGAWRRDAGEPRMDYVASVFARDPFHRKADRLYPAFAPACAKKHLDAGESIPADWPHLLHMIYQVRCNLFHGGKTYESSADRAFVDFAFRILWRVWRQVLPRKMAGLIPWSRAFVRSGIRFTESDDRLQLNEPEYNVTFVRKLLGQVGWDSHLSGSVFRLPCEMVDEQEWLTAWEQCRGGAEGGPTGFENIELEIMDTHLSGVVRWLNGLGITTGLSCEGHGPGRPCWVETETADRGEVRELIERCSARQLTYDGRRIVQSAQMERPPGKGALLRLAEELHQHMANRQMSLHGNAYSPISTL